MSTPEYRRLRNGLFIAGLPIIAAVVFQAFSVYFTMQHKIDREEYQEGLYDLALMLERKTQAIERISLDSEKDHTHLYNEIERINNRIDQLYQRQNALRGGTQ